MIDEIKDSEDIEPQVDVNVDEIMKSVSIDMSMDDKEEPEPKTENKVESEIVEVYPEDEKPSDEDEELTKELYGEFASFLENKTDIKEDTGVKLTISTGIDLVDAVLGGGFAVGGLCIIVGQPGSGKSMLAI